MYSFRLLVVMTRVLLALLYICTHAFTVRKLFFCGVTDISRVAAPTCDLLGFSVYSSDPDETQTSSQKIDTSHPLNSYSYCSGYCSYCEQTRQKSINPFRNAIPVSAHALALLAALPGYPSSVHVLAVCNSNFGDNRNLSHRGQSVTRHCTPGRRGRVASEG